MESANCVLGIEGGGTKTEWVLLEVAEHRERILQQGALPAANLKLISDEALERLFAVLPPEPAQVGVFLAGCGTDEDRRRLLRIVEKFWPKAHLAIGSDRDSALATAFGTDDGIAVIAGTGAAVHGRRSGRIEKAGGWGQLLGDRGSGYDIAMQGLRLVLTGYDLHRRITPLAEMVLQTLMLNRLEDLVDWAMRADKMSVARLAPVFFNAAHNGHPKLVPVVQNGARILADYTRAVAKRLDFAAPRVRALGGALVHHSDYFELFKDYVTDLLPGADVALCTDSGALGAARLASAGKATRPQSILRDAEPVSLSELASATTEQSNPRSAELDQLSTTELVDLFVTEETRVVDALGACRESLVQAVDLVASALQHGGRLFYVGAGTSGRLGVLDASEIPPTFGAPPELVQGIMAGGPSALHRSIEGAEDQPEAGAHAVLERGVKPTDVVCGIAASGRTPFVLGALAKARKIGAKTVLLTCNPARKRSTNPWDAEIDLPTGPEIVTGSTRLKAGTATKVTLNILSTCAMIRLGKVRGNAMVDLNVSNAKLRDRGVRLVSSALGLPYDEARDRLERANWNVRACLP